MKSFEFGSNERKGENPLPGYQIWKGILFY